jgi:hypothetical protein
MNKATAKRLIPFRNCFCGRQSEKFRDGMFLCLRHWQADRMRLLQDPRVTAENIKASNARCEKERYARLRAAGLCVTCGKRESYFGCVRCQECQAKRREYHHAYRGAKSNEPHPWRATA